MDFQPFIDRYEKELFDEVIPFWEEHCVDKEFGGYFISLSSGFHHGFWECWDLKAAEDFSRRHINEMDRRYGSCPSFESWYLDYEIYINFGEERPKIVDLYTAITDLCHGRNGKPVVAPG